jgi:hypothetical protein
VGHTRPASGEGGGTIAGRIVSRSTNRVKGISRRTNHYFCRAIPTLLARRAGDVSLAHVTNRRAVKKLVSRDVSGHRRVALVGDAERLLRAGQWWSLHRFAQQATHEIAIRIKEFGSGIDVLLDEMTIPFRYCRCQARKSWPSLSPSPSASALEFTP